MLNNKLFQNQKSKYRIPTPYQPSSASNKILPANSLIKGYLLNQRISVLKSKGKKESIDKTNSQKFLGANQDERSSKEYMQTLKDKIFSPGDFAPAKNDFQGQKKFMELQKKILESTYTNYQRPAGEGNDNQNTMARLQRLQMLTELNSGNSLNPGNQRLHTEGSKRMVIQLGADGKLSSRNTLNHGECT